MVTTKFCVTPGQAPIDELGIIVQVTVWVLVELFVSKSPIELLLCDDVLSPVTFTLSVADQEQLLGTFDVNETFTAFPVQIVLVVALVIVTDGMTVIVTVCGVPKHDPAVDVGVTA